MPSFFGLRCHPQPTVDAPADLIIAVTFTTVIELSFATIILASAVGCAIAHACGHASSKQQR